MNIEDLLQITETVGEDPVKSDDSDSYDEKDSDRNDDVTNRNYDVTNRNYDVKVKNVKRKKHISILDRYHKQEDEKKQHKRKVNVPKFSKTEITNRPVIIGKNQEGLSKAH